MRSADRPGQAALRHDTLADRLLGLPDGHPSSPRDAGSEDQWWRDDAAGEELPPADQGADREGDEPDQPDAGTELGDQENDDLADPDQPGFDGPGTSDSGGRAVGRRSAGLARGGGEPYRPWFADGDGGGDPWFADGL